MGSGEDHDDVEKIQPDEEGKIPADGEGKYPEVVPWDKYVGVKESLGKKLDAERAKVTSLEERAKEAVSVEEHQRIKDALGESWTEHQKTSDALKAVQDKSAAEKREALKGRGVSDEDLTKMSEAELDTALKLAGSFKPKPDLGAGGGSGQLKGSPIDLARQAYELSSKK